MPADNKHNCRTLCSIKARGKVIYSMSRSFYDSEEHFDNNDIALRSNDVLIRIDEVPLIYLIKRKLKWAASEKRTPLYLTCTECLL